MRIRTAKFVKSVAQCGDCLNDGLPQIAVAGKSNVGKSSFINYLCDNGKLARTSSQPGRTRLINYFLINEQFYLTDLPGYGYAEVSKSELNKWADLIEGYLSLDCRPVHLLLLVDARHLPTDNDKTMYNYIFQCNLPFTVIATKTDKVPRSQLKGNLAKIASAFSIGVDNIIPVSSMAKTGKDRVLERLEQIICAQVIEQ